MVVEATHDRLFQALALIQAQARPTELDGMARFGLVGEGRLGLSIPCMRAIARQLGRDHALAQALWDTGTPDARIVASMVADPSQFTSRQMDAWTRGFAAWDVCDQVCTNAFRASPLAWRKIPVWAQRKDEFGRRAAFALLAVVGVHDRNAPDERFIATLPLIEVAAPDNRNFVKKAVNWALRNIGKRNANLHREAIACALRIQQQGNPSARWIAADALRELRSEAVSGKWSRATPD